MTDPSSLYPRIGVGIVVWRGDTILLVQRRNPPRAGEWALPGGKQHWGETVYETAIREVREECGIDIAPVGLITVLDAITRDAAGGIDFHYTLVEIAAEYVSGDAVAGDDAVDVRWVTLDAIDALCVWPAVGEVARMAQRLRGSARSV